MYLVVRFIDATMQRNICPCITEVFGLNFGRDTRHPDCCCSSFVFRTSKHDAVSELMRASLNITQINEFVNIIPAA
jgi:hypothetical protein